MMYYIGLDVGTPSVKALLVSEEGKVVGSATPEYPFKRLSPCGPKRTLKFGGRQPAKPYVLAWRSQRQ